MLKRALAIAIVLCFTSFAKASLLLYEPFDYPAGSVLVGQTDTYVTPNQTWAPTGTVGTQGGTGPTMTSSSLTRPNYPASIGNAVQTKNTAGDTMTPRISLGTAVGSASGTVFYSLLVNANAVNQTNGTAGSFLAGFNNTTGSQAAALTTIGAALCVHANGTGLSYGITTTNANPTRFFNDAKVFGTSDTVLIVASYTFGPGTADDVANLYINPDQSFLLGGSAEGVPPTPDASSPAVDMSTPGSDFIRTFFVRDNTTEPTGGFNIDEVRVGTTWQDVAIPEPGSALLAASLAPLLLRRRRRERGHMRPPDIARRLA